MLLLKINKNNWEPPKLDKKQLQSCLKEARQCGTIKKEYLSIFKITPYIDSVFISFKDSSLLKVNKIRRFTFKKDYIWSFQDERIWVESCLNNKKCMYTSSVINEIYKYYSINNPWWQLQRYYTKDLRVLDHIYNCMRKNTPKELLYKSGLDELAANIDNFDEINLLATTPVDIYEGIGMRTLQSLNCESGTVLLQNKEGRDLIKYLQRKFPDIFIKKLNNFQCKCIICFLKDGLTFDEIGKLFFEIKLQLSFMWSESQYDFFINKYKLNKIMIEKLVKIDDIYNCFKDKKINYRMRLGIDHKIKMLYKLLIIDKMKYDNMIKKANRKRSDEWQEEDYGYVVRYPKSINDFCREAVYMRNCLLNYLEQMIKNETTIIFMRKHNNVNKPYIVIEVCNNELIQAYRRFNEHCSEDEMIWITEYCKRHGIWSEKILDQ